MQRLLKRTTVVGAPTACNAAFSTTFNFNNLVDKEHESKSFKEILTLPVSAFQGLTPAHDEALAKIRITNINQLGKWKAFKAAQAVVKLSDYEEVGEVGLVVDYNLDKILDKKFQSSSLKQVIKAPLSAIKGITEATALELQASCNLKNLKDLSKWKYAVMAEQLICLSAFEKKEGAAKEEEVESDK